MTGSVSGRDPGMGPGRLSLALLLLFLDREAVDRQRGVGRALGVEGPDPEGVSPRPQAAYVRRGAEGELLVVHLALKAAGARLAGTEGEGDLGGLLLGEDLLRRLDGDRRLRRRRIG